MVKPIPEGYHTVTPFLNIEGASDAIELYKKAFGAEEKGRHLGPDGKIMHAEIQIGDSRIMISDAMQRSVTRASLHLYVRDCDAAWARATAAGLEVELPIADQFWGDRWGLLRDRWGNQWGISTHKEDLAPDEMAKRAEKAMREMPGKP